MDIEEFAKKLNKLAKELKTEINSGDFLKESLEETAKEIQERTRKGFGCDENLGNLKKLKPLSESYKEQRKKMKLGPHATPTKSNLNQTGQMVDNIVVEKNKITVKGGFNQDKAKWNEDTGRSFLNISKQEHTNLVKRLTTKLLKLIKKDID